MTGAGNPNKTDANNKLNVAGTDESDNKNSTTDQWGFFHAFWPRIKKKKDQWDFFHEFWLGIEGEKSQKLKLEEEILNLKRRELLRQYISLATMAPFAVLMAIKLEAACSDMVLLGLINNALNHTVIPFTALSLICTLYLIYNSRKIKKKEQELRNIENKEEIGKSDVPYSKDDYVNCVDAFTSTLVILGGIISQVSGQDIIEDSILLFSNIVGFCIACAFLHSECKKLKEQTYEKSDEKTSNINAATFIFAGAFSLLVRRIMLMATEPSMSINIIGPTLGLIGILSIIIGCILNTRSYSSKLEDIKVTEGKATGAGVNTVSSIGCAEKKCNNSELGNFPI
ncbi:Hypothetical protein CINCED_3A006054 [Cinara cedri]|uniref:Uncharacterized protein n=1 Tax=Cinara cedri TaxID=506608 RepID=A0A5E4MF95_9HEMI|nr:Hypothetical protein CINCED_3A006054 [Cinara cedri]